MMKTSNKIILGAFVIFAISLGVYNTALKAEYSKGTYKDKYNSFNALPFKDFSKVELNAANMMEVEIKQGPFAVYVNKHNQDSVLVKKIGDRLVIDVNMTEKPEMALAYDDTEEPTRKYLNENRFNSVVIVCPNISLLKTDDMFLVNGKKLDKYEYLDARKEFNDKPINVSLFKLDSLTVTAKGRSEVILSANVIKTLKTDIGQRSGLTISSGNIIENLDLNAKAGSEIELGNLAYKFAPGVNTAGHQTSPHVVYNVSDSAKLNMYGFSFNLLKKQ